MIAGWLGEKYKWIKNLWNWAISFITVIKGEFPQKLKDNIPKPELAKLGGGLKDVNYKWMSEHSTNSQGENLFPVISKLGSLPKFLFWCLGSRCSGGGDCTLQNTKHECTEHVSNARCGNKVGEDSQGACSEINEEPELMYNNDNTLTVVGERVKETCTTQSPFHSKYTGCQWILQETCKWGNDIDECFRRLQKEICNSINTKRCNSGEFLVPTNACTFTSFLDPNRAGKRSVKEWKKVVTQNDGELSHWNADP